MNSRERGKLVLNHKEADRVVFDLGGTVLTSIHLNAYKKLRDYLGLPEKEIGVMDIFQQIAAVDDDVRKKLGCDVRSVAPRSSTTFKVDINSTDLPGYDFFHDEWKIGWRKPQDGGFFYDMFDHPLSDATSIDDIKNFPWPNATDPARFTGLKERAKRVAVDQGELAILGGLSAGFFELTCWTRGYGKVYPDMVTNRKWVEYLMDTIIDLKLQYWDIALPMVGEYADVVQEADDVAGQFGLLLNPGYYRSVIKPRHKKIVDFIKARSDAKIFYHCCGAISEIIPDLIDIGFDIINPVQVSAAGMDSKKLKKEYGDHITFWGGVVDTQGVFTEGTQQQVKDEVRRRIDDFAPGGGFVAAAVHNIQANVPPENIMAMWEAIQEYGTFNEDNAPGRRPDSYWQGYPAAPEREITVNTSPDAIAGRALTTEEAAALATKEASLPQVIRDLKEAIIEGQGDDGVVHTNQALADGLSADTIINDGVIPAMDKVGNNFETGEFFLPEMMAAAIVTQEIMKILKPLLIEGGSEPVATAVLGTVKGDLHDIGKSLVAMMWEGAGFDVIDLGPDVSPEKFVEAIKEHNPDLVGLSALLTTTMPMMVKIIAAIDEAGLRDKVKVMIGGAGVTQSFCDEIGADGFAQDASSAVHRAKDILGLS
jgi:uroporphyrinogen decarboxylase